MGWYPCCCSTCSCASQNCEFGLVLTGVTDGSCDVCEQINELELLLVRKAGAECTFERTFTFDVGCYSTVDFTFTLEISGTSLTLTIVEGGGATHVFTGTSSNSDCTQIEGDGLTHSSTTGTAICTFSSATVTLERVNCDFIDVETDASPACTLLCGDPLAASNLTDGVAFCTSDAHTKTELNITGSSIFDPCGTNTVGTSIDGNYRVYNRGADPSYSCEDLIFCSNNQFPSGLGPSPGGAFGGADLAGTTGCWDASGFPTVNYECETCHKGYTCNGTTYSFNYEIRWDVYNSILLVCTLWLSRQPLITSAGNVCNACRCATPYVDCIDGIESTRWYYQGTTAYERPTCDAFTLNLDLVKVPYMIDQVNGCRHFFDMTAATVSVTWDPTL